MQGKIVEDLYSVETLDLILENKFRFDRKYDMEHCPKIVENEPINWELVPFGDPEWGFVFNRMDYCTDLCLHFEKTGEKKYLLKAKELIFDFISKNDGANNVNLRTLDTGIRLIVWDKCLEFLEANNLINGDELDTIYTAIKWQMEYMVTDFQTFQGLNNWGMMQSIGFLTCLKRVDEAQEYIDFYEAMYDNHLNIEFFEDGMQWEQSSVYIVEVVERLLQLNNNKYKNLKYYDCLKRASYALLAITDVDGKSMLNGDGDLIDFIGVLQCLAYVNKDIKLVKHIRKFDIREELVLKYGQDAVDFIKRCDEQINSFEYDLNDAEYYMTKTDNSYLSIQNGIIGYGHGHYDNLHVNLTLGGKKVLVDSGRYSYVNSDPLRAEFKGYRAHNGPYIKSPDLKYIHSWENDGFFETFPVKKVKKNDIVHYETSYMPTKDVICTRKVTRIDSNLVVISDYANDNFNLKYKFFNKYDSMLKENELVTPDFKVIVKNTKDIKLTDEKISCKYNTLKDVSGLEISQKEYEKVFTIFSSDPNLTVEEYTEFEYFHKARLREGEDTFKLFRIRTNNGDYIYGENKYINGNCNNALIIKEKTIMANNFVYNKNTKEAIILKK